MFSSLKFVSAVKNPLSKIKATFKQLIANQRIELTPIIPQKLYHISTPSEGNMESLLQEFKSANQFQLWNISEYAYDEKILSRIMQGRERNSDGRQIVYNLTYEYFANIPFCEMIKSIETIETFLSLNPKNKVYIHCQENKRRSAIFLACYIFLTGLQSDIVSSILKVNKLLRISMQQKEVSQNNTGSIYKSQHIVLKNLMNYINNSNFINKNGWNLRKILIANAPKIHAVLKTPSTGAQQIKFKVLLQIRSVEGISYKKIFHDEFIQGESLCLRIPLDETVVLKDDFVLIIKYVHEKKGYSVLRAQLNTNFIYDLYCRVQRNDMDLSVNNAHSKANDTIFMDLLLENNPQELSELSQIHILKDNLENQIPSSTQQAVKQNPPADKVQINKDEKSEDQEDGFGILDEEQEAVHNQKMQREIQEQLARQLEKIRRKKTQQEQKIVKAEVAEQKAQSENVYEQDTKDISQSSKQAQKAQQKPSKPVPEQTPSPAIASSNQPEATEHQNAAQTNQQHHSSSDHDQQSQSESSEQSESSSEQQEQEEEDLDDYLSKLEKQAENHD